MGSAVAHVQWDGSPQDSSLKPQVPPTGVIVGTAVISHCTNGGTGATAYRWHLTDVQRIAPDKQRKPKRQPQPAWFRPF